jgi:RNA recognition motif-containing protein
MAYLEDDYVLLSAADVCVNSSESTSIPKNPRTDRPVGYAFVDLSTPSEAERAIAELSGKEILERKVSVQLARKPEPAGEKAEGTASGGEAGGEGNRRRPSGRGRGRGRGRGGRGGRTGDRTVSCSSIAQRLEVID